MTETASTAPDDEPRGRFIVQVLSRHEIENRRVYPSPETALNGARALADDRSESLAFVLNIDEPAAVGPPPEPPPPPPSWALLLSPDELGRPSFFMASGGKFTLNEREAKRYRTRDDAFDDRCIARAHHPKLKGLTFRPIPVDLNALTL